MKPYSAIIARLSFQELRWYHEMNPTEELGARKRLARLSGGWRQSAVPDPRDEVDEPQLAAVCFPALAMHEDVFANPRQFDPENFFLAVGSRRVVGSRGAAVGGGQDGAGPARCGSEDFGPPTPEFAAIAARAVQALYRSRADLQVGGQALSATLVSCNLTGPTSKAVKRRSAEQGGKQCPLLPASAA